jgi:hypothetical protein
MRQRRVASGHPIEIKHLGQCIDHLKANIVRRISVSAPRIADADKKLSMDA